MRDERRWELAALYGCIGAAAGTMLGTASLLSLGPAAIAGGAFLGGAAGFAVGLLLKRDSGKD